jgi:hypothetical protein
VLARGDSPGVQGRLTDNELLADDADDPAHLRIIASVRVRNRRGTIEIMSGDGPRIRRDPILINALRRAHAMIEFDSKSLPICRAVPETQYSRRLVRLAFLAPDLQKMIISGRQPAGLNLEQLMTPPLPVDWGEQRKRFA